MDRRSFMGGVVAGASGAALLGVATSYARTAAQPAPAAPPAAPQPALPQYARLSFAQQGEDIVLYHLLHHGMRIEAPTYLDIGAADPIESSNTYLEHWNGGHGVLVEPNPMYQERLHKCRPRDTIVQAGVGIDGSTEADYYVIRDNPTWNTFSAEDVAVRRKASNADIVEKVIRMPLVGVNDLIAKYLGAAPDLFSIDVEGWDLPILKTLDFAKYRPAVIIAESLPVGEIPRFLATKGYALRGASMYNAIFADPRRFV
jgi:FkbM family methyltransferase